MFPYHLASYCTVGIADMMHKMKSDQLYKRKEQTMQEYYTWQLTAWHTEIAIG